ncbi:dihydroorotase [Besnoitia besnoiti]|uniref:dihydroorotase n=1 Tax=Besnoitia besnoiti TaxID=94643 RepID=A0A2A9MBT4_BESBE|nr:dihydroorotase [Besnoitia besnoiti]PFH33077.1 dihydroorotase [Besnoitia besnoiti]
MADEPVSQQNGARNGEGSPCGCPPASKPMIIPLISDMHVHLRQDEMAKLVTPTIKPGGCRRVLVMPNTVPPVTTCEQAAAYREQLISLDSSVEYLMTLFLSPELSIDDLRQNAKACRVVGVKSYPKGVTTNSDKGVESYEQYYPLFEAMEELGLTLHLHGEVPGVAALDAEEAFLPFFEQLHARFPSLKIVLEHVSTAAAIQTIKRMPSNVGATITPHHLLITVDDVMKAETVKMATESGGNRALCCAGAVANPHNFCKPLAKMNEDRAALQQVVREGDSHFFLGSDSAPHPRTSKEGSPPAAGVFTQPLLLAYLTDIFAKLGCLSKLRKFADVNAATFFGFDAATLEEDAECAVIYPAPQTVPAIFNIAGQPGEGVVPFIAGKELSYTVTVQRLTSTMLKEFEEL